jgi:hypothetical protein
MYRDITVPSGETSIMLSFDWKSAAGSYNVYAAPTSFTPVNGTAMSVGVANNTGAATGTYLLAAGTTTGTTYASPAARKYVCIPPMYAGTTFRLIFMAVSPLSGTVDMPLAIDNVTLISRVPASYTSAATGAWDNAATWGGTLGSLAFPSSVDNVTIATGHTVNINPANLAGANNLDVTGTLQFSTDTPVNTQTIAYQDFQVRGTATINSGGSFKLFEPGGNAGRRVAFAGDIVNNGNFDVATASTATGNGATMYLNGSALQTVGGSGTWGNGATYANMFTTLVVANTSTAIPNVQWNVSNAKIRSTLDLGGGQNNGIVDATGVFRLAGTMYARVALGGTTPDFYIGGLGTSGVPSTGNTASFRWLTGNGFLNGNVRRWFDNSSTGTAFSANADINGQQIGLSIPFVTSTGKDRSFHIHRPLAAGFTAGELNFAYTDAATISSASVTDGTYSINNRADASWAVTKPSGSTFAVPSIAGVTVNIAIAAEGLYTNNGGASRIMLASAALSGAHQAGTNKITAQRTGVTSADLINTFYLGYNTADATSITTAGSGNWNNTATWVGGVVPTCADMVSILAGHTVTVNSTEAAAGINVYNGGALINASGSLTVGSCAAASHNAVFNNKGAYTISGGTLTVNGRMNNFAGSSFAQTAGDIVIDGNHADDVNLSSASGALFALNTSSVTLSGGKITIVDPAAVAAAVSLTTGATHAVRLATTQSSGTNGVIAGSTAMVLSGANAKIKVGGAVYGLGIAPGTTVSAMSGTSVTLSQAATATTPNFTTYTFDGLGSTTNASTTLTVPQSMSTTYLIGATVSGTGIVPGTTVTAAPSGTTVTLSVAATATGNADITFSAINAIESGRDVVILPNFDYRIVASGSNQSITGPGIPASTYVSSIWGNMVKMTQAATATTSGTVTFYNDPAVAFLYNAGANAAATGTHTVQFGDGVSTEGGIAGTKGFNVQFTGTSPNELVLNNVILDGVTKNRSITTANGSSFKVTNLTINSGSYGRFSAFFNCRGNLVNNGEILLGGGSSNFDGTTAQTISGSGAFYGQDYIFGANKFSVNNLSISNPAGVTITAAGLVYLNQLSLNAGILHVPNGIKVGTNEAVSALSANSFMSGVYGNNCYVDGPIARTFSASSLASAINTSADNFLFPVGAAGVYTPVWVAPSTTAGARIQVVRSTTSIDGYSEGSSCAALASESWIVNRLEGSQTNFNVAVATPTVANNNIPLLATATLGGYESSFGIFPSPFTAGTPNKTVGQTALTTGNNGLTETAYISYGTQLNCLGAGAPGNTLASTASVCGSTPVTLTLSGSPLQGEGLLYQWQSSPDNVTFTNIGAATITNSTVVTPGANTWYRCQVTCPYFGAPATSTAVQVSYSNTGAPTTTGATICAGSTATLGATGSGTLSWYAAVTGGAPLATGSSFVTPALSADTTYYVSSAGSTTTTNTINKSGAVQPLGIPATSGITSIWNGMVFHTDKDVTINSVVVYPQYTGTPTPITMKMFDNTGTQIGAAVTFTPSLVSPSLTNNTITQTVPVNISVPKGNGFMLMVTDGINATQRIGQSGFDMQYGMTSYVNGVRLAGFVGGNMLAPTITTVGQTGTNRLYFWDWNVSSLCNSARVPVTATVKQFYDFYADNDNDGYGAGPAVSLCAVNATTPPAGYSVNNTDCDDTLATLHSGAVITTQPESESICKLIGATATFSVVGTAGTGTTYQWYKAGATPTAIAGATSATYTVTKTTTTAPASGTQYYVVISGACGTITSNTVTLTDTTTASKAAKITSSSHSKLIACTGSSVTLVAAAGSMGDIDLEASTDGGTTWTVVQTVTGTESVANGAITFTPILLTQTTKFRTVATNGACAEIAYATPTTFTISAQQTAFNVSGGNVTVCKPGSVLDVAAVNPSDTKVPNTNSTTLSINASLVSGGYITWYKTNVDPSGPTSWGKAFVGATGVATWDAVNVSKDTWYKAVVTNGACTLESGNYQKITVTVPAKAGKITASTATVCYAVGTVTFTSSVYVGDSIQWQVSVDGGATYANAIGTGATTDTFVLDMANYPSVAALSKIYVRNKVVSGTCSSAFAAPKNLLVNPTSVGGTVTGGGSICAGAGGTLKLSGHTGKTIVWMSSTDGTNFTAVPLATATTLVVSGIAVDTYYKAVVTSGVCTSADSNVVLFAVKTAPTAGTITAGATSCATGTALTLSGYDGVITWQKAKALAGPVPGPFATVGALKGASVNTGVVTAVTYYQASVSLPGCLTPAIASPVSVAITSTNCTAKSIGTENATSIEAAQSTFDVVAYPNPFASNFNLNLTSSSVEKVGFVVYDMTGRLIEQREVNHADVHEVQFGDNYPTGIYNVIVNQGNEVKSLRVIKR